MHAFKNRFSARLVCGLGLVLAVPLVMAQAPKDVTATPAAKPGQEIQARCLPLSGDFRVACEARAMGSGSTSSPPRRIEIVVLPPGADRTRVEPLTSDPLVVVPAPSR